MAKAEAKAYGIRYKNRLTCDRLRISDCDCSRLQKVDQRAIYLSQKSDTRHQILNHRGMSHPGGGGIDVFVRTSFIQRNRTEN